MNKLTTGAVVIALLAASLYAYNERRGNNLISEGSVACTMEARQCPDGSFVGRVGSQCQFAACPPVGVSLNEAVTIGQTEIIPLRIVEDSRCPVDAECVWAGSLIVEVAISSPDIEEVRQMSLGDTVMTELGELVLDRAEPEPSVSNEPGLSYTLFFVEER